MSLVDTAALADSATYWYEGYCRQTGALLRLPRTRLSESIAHQLMQQLALDQQYNREGKMYGVLLVETRSGERQVLKAFSGLLNGKNTVEGWVPPIAGRNQVALEEAHTLTLLDTIKQDLITLQHLPERQQYESLAQEFETRLHQLNRCHQQRKQQRKQQRQHLTQTLANEALTTALECLAHESQREGIERRHLKQQRDAALEPLRQIVDQADTRIQLLKQRRKALSRQLQAQMHAAYKLTNFAGESLSLETLKLGGLPTGTGECCAPKLLHYAATHTLKPLAMAEFWWGPSIGDKLQGEFYAACAERCQPLMGFLLSGLPQSPPPLITLSAVSIPILYEDQSLIAVNKPAGLLSVPGRYAANQDSVLSRLRALRGEALIAVHRLDQDTSGILVLARDIQTYRQLSRQFQQRQVHKVYEAVVSGAVAADVGVIDLPLWGDPTDRPRQTVDRQRGKPSRTEFHVMERTGHLTRVEFVPITGRTHQLRVHAADANGLGTPILGDRLYGGCDFSKAGSDPDNSAAHRLHLHARELRFQHPHTGEPVHLQSNAPF
jgi:tRNA pseudouridine32 synthase / 23S rRNA pseudouridine746 synthase